MRTPPDLRLAAPELEPPDHLVHQLAELARTSVPAAGSAAGRRLAPVSVVAAGALLASVGGAWATGVIEVPGLPSPRQESPAPAAPGEPSGVDDKGESPADESTTGGESSGDHTGPGSTDESEARERGTDHDETGADFPPGEAPGSQASDESATGTPGDDTGPGDNAGGGRGENNGKRPDTIPGQTKDKDKNKKDEATEKREGTGQSTPGSADKDKGKDTPESAPRGRSEPRTQDRAERADTGQSKSEGRGSEASPGKSAVDSADPGHDSDSGNGHARR